MKKLPNAKVKLIPADNLKKVRKYYKEKKLEHITHKKRKV